MMGTGLPLGKLIRIYWFQCQWYIRATVAEMLFELARWIQP